MSKSHRKTYSSIGRKWQLIRGAETILLAAIFTVPVFLAAAMFNLQNGEMWLLTGLFFIILAVSLAFKNRVFNLPSGEVPRYLNQRFVQLENSAEILLKDESTLSVVERIHKQKIEKRISEIIPQFKIPSRIFLHLGLLTIAILLLVYFPTQPGNVQIATDTDLAIQAQESAENKQARNLPLEIKAASVTIHPPAYTRLTSRTSDELALKVTEGSLVSWNITFSDSIKKAFLVFDNGDSIRLQRNTDFYKTQKTLKKDGFYYIRWCAEKDTLQSEYYAIHVHPDQAPVVEIRETDQYLEIPHNMENNSINLSVIATDDYGITSAHIVATVSRGSGEAVKFREEKLHFEEKLKESPKKVSLEKTVNLHALGMAPGDELYYYVVVADNKLPKANISRTDTYFINIQDTAKSEIAISAGLGIDQMPEYFRSQRQIIIDTEKIIEEAPILSKSEYQERLNKLGIDQKLLRLRYGQFLGEEFESGITSEVEAFVHEENEAHGHDHAEGEGHDHHHDERSPAQDEEASLESYMHIHDYQGEATFFDDAIKAQLKAALSQMWESELRLRTYRPKEALPFEYKALELIKEIQQKSRVYVERIGFEPPALKPNENRLTRDLDEIKSINLRRQLKEEELYPAIRSALAMVEISLQSNQENFSYDRSIIERAGQELAALAVEEPGRYLRSLASFRILADQNVSTGEQRKHLTIIREAMQHVLPEVGVTPYKQELTQNELFRIFQLELSKREGL